VPRREDNGMPVEDLKVDRARLAEVWHGVARLEVFGSFSCGDAEAGSDHGCRHQLAGWRGVRAERDR